MDIPEILTPREERFDRLRHTIGLGLGPLVALVVYLLPIRGLERPAHTLAAVLSWVVVWWISEPIPLPMTAVLGAGLAVVLGVAPAKTVMAPFADPMIFLFLGSFILAEAMAHHRLDQRFAYGIMSLRWVGNRSGRLLFAYGGICAFVSMWISNTATCAMMFPIGLGIIRAMSELTARRTGQPVEGKNLRFGTAMMLMAAYASSAGGIGTPVGTPPNLIGISLIEKFTGVRIPFFKWMLFAVPLLTLMYLLLYALLYLLHRPEEKEVHGGAEFVRAELRKLGGWTRGQKLALFCLYHGRRPVDRAGLHRPDLGQRLRPGPHLQRPRTRSGGRRARRPSPLRPARRLEEAGVRHVLEAGGPDRLGRRCSSTAAALPSAT